jgi:hypothetical protein
VLSELTDAGFWAERLPIPMSCHLRGAATTTGSDHFADPRVKELRVGNGSKRQFPALRIYAVIGLTWF